MPGPPYPACSVGAVPHPRRHSTSRIERDALAPSEGWFVLTGSALAIFTAWALGGVVDWAQEWMAILALATLPLVWAKYRETRRLELLPFLPALLWAAYAMTALLNPSHTPLPTGGWAERAGWIRWLPTTVDSGRTLAEARIVISMLILGGAATVLLRSRRAAGLLWSACALNGFALAATGACLHFAGAERMLGAIDVPERSYFFATFFYKNHWASYGALTAAAALTLALRAWPAALAGDPRARGQVALFGAAGLLTAVTLPLPGSRAGALLAIALAGGFLAGLIIGWWRRRKAHGNARPALAGIILAAAGILAYGAWAYAPRATVDLARTRQQVARHLDGEALDVRAHLSRDTWSMSAQRPWFGWGPGSFEVVFPLFHGAYLRDANGRPQARVEFAHNDWLQLLAETGRLGALILLIPLALTAWRGWREGGPAGRAGLAGCGLIALHGWIDFPLHAPAVLALWVLMLTTARRLDPPAAGD